MIGNNKNKMPLPMHSKLGLIKKVPDHSKQSHFQSLATKRMIIKSTVYIYYIPKTLVRNVFILKSKKKV